MNIDAQWFSFTKNEFEKTLFCLLELFNMSDLVDEVQLRTVCWHWNRRINDKNEFHLFYSLGRRSKNGHCVQSKRLNRHLRIDFQFVSGQSSFYVWFISFLFCYHREFSSLNHFYLRPKIHRKKRKKDTDESLYECHVALRMTKNSSITRRGNNYKDFRLVFLYWEWVIGLTRISLKNFFFVHGCFFFFINRVDMMRKKSLNVESVDKKPHGPWTSV